MDALRDPLLPRESREDALVGCLLGTAVGDALGLPLEGLSKRRQRRLFPEPDRHHFVFGRGMISDDTEHTCMVAQALLVSGGDPRTFARDLARRLRWWLLALPAGVGFATLRAILKLWLGVSPERSGVFSAGNGPAMRSAVLGVCRGHEPERLRALVRASTRLTHTDPKAEHGALAVALAAHMAAGRASHESYLSSLRVLLGQEGEELFELIGAAASSARAGQTPEQFAAGLGLERGVSGYVMHTVPVALQAWFRYPSDYRSAVVEVIRCGGDTDSVAAITGGIVGAGVGKAGIPGEWLDGLRDWPRSVRWMQDLGERLAGGCRGGEPTSALRLPVAGIVPRNVLFLLVVLALGFRRLLPPY